MEVLYTEYYNALNVLPDSVQILLTLGSFCGAIALLYPLTVLVERIQARMRGFPRGKIYPALLLTLGFAIIPIYCSATMIKTSNTETNYIIHREVVFTDDSVPLTFFEEWHFKERKGEVWVIEPNEKMRDEK